MSKKSKRPVKGPTITTTEPTATPVELAGIGARLAAVIYDGLLIVAVNAIVAVILVVIATPSDASSQNQTQVLSANFRHLVLFPAMIVMTWLFYGYFWRKTGQTLGMQTWRLKVIKPSGRFLSWGDSAGRCAAALIFPICCGLLATFLGMAQAFLLLVSYWVLLPIIYGLGSMVVVWHGTTSFQPQSLFVWRLTLDKNVAF